MNQWTPAAVTKMILQLASFGAILYLIVTGGFSTADIVAISGILTGAVSGFLKSGSDTPDTASVGK